MSSSSAAATAAPSSSATNTNSNTTTNSTNNSNNNNNNNNNKKKIPQWREAVAGASAGALSRTLLAPVERVKLLKQLRGSVVVVAVVAGSQAHPEPAHPSSAWHVAQTVYREQGVRAFWRGNVPNVLRVSGMAAINFTCMDYYKRAAVGPWLDYCYSGTTTTASDPRQVERQRQRVVSFVSGGLAGATGTTLLYPMEFVRTRLAMDLGADEHNNTNNNSKNNSNKTPRQYQGMLDVTRKIIQSDGVRGLFQGYGIALAGGIFYRVLLLGGYDALKGELLFRKTTESIASSHSHAQQQSSSVHTTAAATTTTAPELSWFERLVSAQFVSTTAGTLSYPLDSVRRRLMMQAGLATAARLYRNSWQCARHVWQREGVRGFYLGLGPNLVRSISGALLLVGYDRVRTLL